MSKSNFDGEITDEQFNVAALEVKEYAINEQWDKLENLLRQTRAINLNLEKELLSSLTLQQFTLYKHYLQDE